MFHFLENAIIPLFIFVLIFTTIQAALEIDRLEETLAAAKAEHASLMAAHTALTADLSAWRDSFLQTQEKLNNCRATLDR